MVETVVQVIHDALPHNFTIITFPCDNYSPNNSIKNDQNNTPNNTSEANYTSKINQNKEINCQNKNERNFNSNFNNQILDLPQLKEKPNDIYEEYHLTDENEIEYNNLHEDNSSKKNDDTNHSDNANSQPQNKQIPNTENYKKGKPKSKNDRNDLPLLKEDQLISKNYDGSYSKIKKFDFVHIVNAEFTSCNQKVNDDSIIVEENLCISHSQQISSSKPNLTFNKSRNNRRSCSQQIQRGFLLTCAKNAKILKNIPTDDYYSDYESSYDEDEQNDNSYCSYPQYNSEIKNKKESHLVFSKSQNYRFNDSNKSEEFVSSNGKNKTIHQKNVDCQSIVLQKQNYQLDKSIQYQLVSDKCEEFILSNNNKKVIHQKDDDIHLIFTKSQDYQSIDSCQHPLVSEKCEEFISSNDNKKVVNQKVDNSDQYQLNSEKCQELISSNSKKKVTHQKYGNVHLVVTKSQDYQSIDSKKSEKFISSNSNKRIVYQKIDKNNSITPTKQNYRLNNPNQYLFISDKCEKFLPLNNDNQNDDDQSVVIKNQNDQSNNSDKCKEFASSNNNERTIFHTDNNQYARRNFNSDDTNEYNYLSDLEQPFTYQENDDDEQNFNQNSSRYLLSNSRQNHHIKHIKGNKKHICHNNEQENSESQRENDSNTNDYQSDNDNDNDNGNQSDLVSNSPKSFGEIRNKLYKYFFKYETMNTKIDAFKIKEEIRSSCCELEKNSNINISQILFEYCENEIFIEDRSELFDPEKLKFNEEFFSTKFKKSTDQLINEIENKKIFPDVKCIVDIVFSSLGIKSLSAFFEKKIEAIFSSSCDSISGNSQISFWINVDEDSIKNLKSKINDELYGNI